VRERGDSVGRITFVVGCQGQVCWTSDNSHSLHSAFAEMRMWIRSFAIVRKPTTIFGCPAAAADPREHFPGAGPSSVGRWQSCRRRSGGALRSLFAELPRGEVANRYPGCARHSTRAVGRWRILISPDLHRLVAAPGRESALQPGSAPGMGAAGLPGASWHPGRGEWKMTRRSGHCWHVACYTDIV
jgi:hypothetical protein